jgi:hypothetical protein
VRGLPAKAAKVWAASGGEDAVRVLWLCEGARGGGGPHQQEVTRPRPGGSIFVNLETPILLFTCQYRYNIIINSVSRLIRHRGITDFIFY